MVQSYVVAGLLVSRVNILTVSPVLRVQKENFLSTLFPLGVLPDFSKAVSSEAGNGFSALVTTFPLKEVAHSSWVQLICNWHFYCSHYKHYCRHY